MAIGGLLYAATYVVLWSTASVTPIVLAQLLLGAGYALFKLASVNLAHRISPWSLKSTAQSLLLVGGVSTGTAIGELLTGRLVDVIGPQDVFGALAGLGVVVTVISLTLSPDAIVETSAVGTSVDAE